MESESKGVLFRSVLTKLCSFSQVCKERRKREGKREEEKEKEREKKKKR